MEKIEFIDFCGFLNSEMPLNKAIYWWHDFKNNHEQLINIMIEFEPNFTVDKSDFQANKAIQQDLQCSIMQAEIYKRIFFSHK